MNLTPVISVTLTLYLSADTVPICIHNVFCVPKFGGDCYRAIIDCSKPSGYSVNNFVYQVCTKSSYNGVDDLVGNMKDFDYIATIDIKDAYRAIWIHPSDRPRQGIIWVLARDPVCILIIA